MSGALQTVFQTAPGRIVAVIGATDASSELKRAARRVGRLLAEAGLTVVTGGRAGIMEAACEGAAQAGGLTVGILPGSDASDSPPNPYVAVPIYTGLGEARNTIVVRTARVVIAIGGCFGTLSEIGFALAIGRPVILLHSWTLTPDAPMAEMSALLRTASDPREAAQMAVALAGAAGPPSGEEPDAERPAARG